MNFRKTLFRTVAAATVITGVAPTLAHAQQGGPQQAPRATEATQDDEIVVTARRREEALQDVPISVTAFSAATIEDRLIQNTTDLAAFTPGFSFSEAFGRDGDRPVIRGTANILITDGKVGTFIDGMPVLGDTSGIDLEAFQRVEIIKGPQAAVFGRGTLSGAINYVSRPPSDEASVKLEATFGGNDRYDFMVRAEGPVTALGLGDWLNYSFYYKHYEFGGDYTNQLDSSKKLGAQQSDSFNVALFAQFSDTLSANVRYISSVDNDSHFAVQLQPASQNNCFLTTRPTYCGTIQTPTTFSINTADILRPGLRRESDRLLWGVNWDLSDALTLRYQGTSTAQSEVSGYDQSYDGRTFHISPAFASCSVPLPNRRCGFSPFNDTSGFNEDAQTNELKLEWDNGGPFRGRLGYFMLDRVRKNDLKWLELTVGGPDAAGSRAGTETEAWFAGVDFDITPDLKLGVEVRQNKDTITDTQLGYRVGDFFPTAPSGTLSFNPAAIVTDASATPAGTRRTSTFEATLPRVTLDYRLNDQVLVYGQYAVGNAPGGFNSASAPSPTFDEEKLTNYEVGLKTQLLGFNYLNLSAFLMNYDNQVLTTNFATATAVQSYNVNIGKQEIKGVEFEAQRELFDGFTITGTLSYVDGEFTEGVDPQQALFTAGAFCSAATPPTAATATNPWGYGTTAALVQAGTGAPLTTSTPPRPNGTTVLTSTVVTPNGGVPAGVSCAQLASIVGKQSPLVPPLQASLSTRYEVPIGDSLIFMGADVTYRDSFYAQVDNLQETGASTKLNAQIGWESGPLKATLWGRNVLNEDTPEGILRYVDFLQPPPPGPTLTGGTVNAPAGGPGFQGTPRAFAVAMPRKSAFGVTVSLSW